MYMHVFFTYRLVSYAKNEQGIQLSSHLKSEEVEGSDGHALSLMVRLGESSPLVAEPLAHLVEKTVQLLERRPTHVDTERQLRAD